MSKPSIADLLNASGHTIYTPELVQRAMYSLYGNNKMGDRPRFSVAAPVHRLAAAGRT